LCFFFFFFFSSRRRHTRFSRDWSSDVCSSDLYYLFTKTLAWDLLLPATACGLLATSVLNINNVRDIETDAVSGKITLAVRLGRKIGRASCRERVWVSVVEGACKKESVGVGGEW